MDKICTGSFGDKTTLYQIEKGFKSSGNSIIVRFYDELYQPNAIDKDGVPQQKCDESWSMDNIRVRGKISMKLKNLYFYFFQFNIRAEC